jgi:hypothetical protein
MTINTNGQVEFGQGRLLSTSCDKNGIQVVPINSFVNENKAGTFTFNAIQFQHISSECSGKDFIIKVYDSSGSAIPISDQDGRKVTQVRVHFNEFDTSIPMFQDGVTNSVSNGGYWSDQFMLVGSDPIVVGTLTNLDKINTDEIDPSNPAYSYFRMDPEDNSFQISFVPSPQIRNGFADAKNIYRITLESAAHQD